MRLAALLLVCACVQSHEVPCGDGRLCPAGNTCDDANHRCLSPEQIAACDGHAEGDGCSLTGVTGVCQAGVCEPLICGDGIRTGTESCDGSDLGGATCQTAGFYAPDGLACTPFCTFDTAQCKGSCGDGIVQPEELCDGAPPATTCVDDGFDAGVLACSVSCGVSFAGCGRFGWRPEVSGLDFLASLDGKGVDDLWASGQQGTTGVIAHFDGSSWSTVATVPGHSVSRIVEVSPDDVWVLDSITTAPAVIHLSSGQVEIRTDVPAGKYEDLLALAANDVYVVTSDIGLLHWNGATWQPVGALPSASAPCTVCSMALVGTSASDLWVVRTDGSLMHWNGMAWQSAGLAATVRRISSTSPTNVWVTGGSATVLSLVAHWDGATWTTYPAGPVHQSSYSAILTLADNDVWAALTGGSVTHFDGLGWTATDSKMAPASTTAGFLALVKVGDQIVGATSDGFIARYSGQLVARYDTGITGQTTKIWGLRPDDTWLGNSRGEVWHYDGDAWSVALTATANKAIRGLIGTAAADVWAWNASGEVYRFQGSGWALEPRVGFSGQAAWGSSPSDMWFFDTTITHFDGVAQLLAFTPPPGTTFSAAAGTGPNDIWAAAGTGPIYHWDGASWLLAYTAAGGVTSIVATAPGEVIALSTDRRIHRLHGGTWQATLLPALTALSIASATGSDDVFAAAASEIFHFDGTRWSPVRAPSDPLLGVDSIRSIDAHPGYVDFAYADNLGSQQVRRLVRTRPWDCTMTETACADGVDNDCDGLVDGNDPDCP